MEKFSHLHTGGYYSAIKLIGQRKEMGIKTAVFTPNAEMLSRCATDKGLEKLLLKGDILLPDGIGIYAAAKFSGMRLLERTNGIDFAERLMESLGGDMSVFLLGAAPGVPEMAAESLKKRYPALTIAGCHHGYFSDEEEIIQRIDLSGADTLFVCLGFPKQEGWIIENLESLGNVNLAVGLGGSLDVWAGNQERAPKFFRALGLEWLFRIFLSPERLSRTPSLFHFIILWMKGKIVF